MISLPDINSIFDVNFQDFPNYLPANSHYTDLQTQSNSSYQSLQLANLSPTIYNPESLVIPSMLSMTLSTNLYSHPQSAYKQYIPSLLPSYEDTQQPIMSHQQDYFAIPTLSMTKIVGI